MWNLTIGLFGIAQPHVNSARSSATSIDQRIQSTERAQQTYHERLKERTELEEARHGFFPYMRFVSRERAAYSIKSLSFEYAL
jgi:hypothetical protein